MTVADHPALVALYYVRDHVHGPHASTVSVAMGLAANVDRYGWAAISIRALATQCNLGFNVVSEGVNRLEADGHVEIVRSGRGYRYRFSTAQLELFSSGDRSRASGDRSRASGDHPSTTSVRRRLISSGDQSRAPGDRSRASGDRSRASDARSRPGGGGTSTRRTSETTTDALLPHGTEALTRYVDEEVRAAIVAKTIRRTAGALRNHLESKYTPIVLEHQDHADANELLAILANGKPVEISPADAERARWQRPMAGWDDPVDEEIERDSTKAMAAFARGRAEASEGVA